VEAANVEFNPQTLYRLSDREVDLARVRELTEILDQAGDPRAKKGHDLLTDPDCAAQAVPCRSASIRSHLWRAQKAAPTLHAA
jgi:hypothetical protein